MNKASSFSRRKLLHDPVFLEEAVDGLNISSHGTYVDATFGRGGHSVEILSRLGVDGRLIAMDKDPEAIECGQTFRDKRLSVHHGSFSELHKLLKELKIEKVNGVLMDLGISSPQVDSSCRGFSFQNTGPLDMRQKKIHRLAHDSFRERVDFGKVRHPAPKYEQVELAIMAQGSPKP